MDQIVNNGQLDTETKIARYYNPEKMHNAVFLMEQFYALSTHPSLDAKKKIAAKKLFEHYRRLVLCIGAKEMPPTLNVYQVVNEQFMKDLYKGYQA